MKIIVGTDFSQAARVATDVAAALVRQLGDELVLVHGLEAPLPVTMIGGEVTVAQFLDAFRQPVRDELNRATAELRARGLKVEPVLRDGPGAQVVLDVARDAGARMIVLASHGRSLLDRAMLGSVADRVVRGADRPVLVVGENGPALAGALGAGRPLHLAVAVEASRASDAAVGWVRAFCARATVDVTFVHAYWPPGEYERLGLAGFRNMYAPDPEVVSVVEQELRQRIGVMPGAGRVAYLVQPNLGRAAEAVTSEAETLRADLLVVGTRARAGLRHFWPPSTAVGVLHAGSNLSVLCVPERTFVAPTRQDAPPPVRRVLAVTDLSDEGNAAVRQAYALVSRGGSVELCHVVAPDMDPGRPKRPDLEARLRALVPPDAAAAGIITHVTVGEGYEVGKTVCQTAERSGSDVIVLAARRRPRFALGNVVHDVLSGTRRPVLLVQPE